MAVLFLDVVVGHACNVGADDAVKGLRLHLVLIGRRQFLRHFHEKLEQFFDYLLCSFLISLEHGAEVKALVQKYLELSPLVLYLLAESKQTRRMAADRIRRRRFCLSQRDR